MRAKPPRSMRRMRGSACKSSNGNILSMAALAANSAAGIAAMASARQQHHGGNDENNQSNKNRQHMLWHRAAYQNKRSISSVMAIIGGAWPASAAKQHGVKYSSAIIAYASAKTIVAQPQQRQRALAHNAHDALGVTS